MSSTPRATLGVLWGKSDPHTSLLQHLLDTAAVAERIWDGYLAPAVRDRLDTCSGGRGRSLLALLCGLHDLGKATPAFQDKVPPLADAVRATGLHWRSLSGSARSWHHPLAGALIARTVLSSAGWDTPTIRWVWPLIAGHHGMVPGADAIRPPTPDAHGRGPAWGGCQHDLVDAVAEALGLDLTTIAPTSTPRRA
ncbi:MAG: CRISPR-associated endonuclease Cas3'', partial [Dactylosporangium sp.]|nr:CRISPR-associated endonuclease Cas3'' [Dactylosporangium sp.]NNJ59360.1 CRISPR-associated endonuclease Cas3'' [Dactylosporangium sp.]